MIPAQCRAARGWLNWTQQDLAAKARVSLSTVKDYEADRRTPMHNNLEAMLSAFSRGGVQFTFDPAGGASGITVNRNLAGDVPGAER